MSKVFMVSMGSSIVEVELLRETKQYFSFNPDQIRSIRGRTYYVPSRLKRSSAAYVVFRTLRDAYAYCLTVATLRVDRLAEDLAAAQKSRQRLQEEIEQAFEEEEWNVGADKASEGV